jgi:uncharacterized membrane protein HdeD (DUF308 family)
VRQNRKAGRYLIRGFFAATLGLLWLAAAKGFAALTPSLFIALFCIIFGAEMIVISSLRERARGSLT